MKKILQNPLGVSCSESNTNSSLPAPTDLVSFDGNTLFLSCFVVEYKKWTDDATKALNQERTYLVSVVTHLATLGIKGFPVFGLVTSGQVGGVLMAWKSEVNDVRVLTTFFHTVPVLICVPQKINIIERNIRTYNLTSPIQAFHFASFLLRLREHTDTLKGLFDKGKGKFFKQAEKEQLLKWTHEEQYPAPMIGLKQKQLDHMV